jgi:hypothetical protein
VCEQVFWEHTARTASRWTEGSGRVKEWNGRWNDTGGWIARMGGCRGKGEGKTGRGTEREKDEAREERREESRGWQEV